MKGVNFLILYQSIDPDIPIVMCGDFNATVDPHINRFGCNPESPWANNWASARCELMSTFTLCDAWRASHPDIKEYTWKRTNGSQGSLIWLPQCYLGLVRKIEILPFLRSNHQCVYLKDNFPWGVERGPGLWKFNISLLQNKAFCTGVHDIWCSWHLACGRFSLLSNWYEAGKVHLHQFIIDFSRNLVRENKSKFTKLNSRLADLERRVSHGKNLSALLEETRGELDEYLSHQAQGAMLWHRSRRQQRGKDLCFSQVMHEQYHYKSQLKTCYFLTPD